MYKQRYGQQYEKLEGTNMAQFLLSIILSCFVILQFILGFVVRAEMNKSKLSKNFFRLKLVHKIVGNGL
jgi:hypothetical protein